MKNRPVKFRQYQQDPRNGKVRVIKPAQKPRKLPDPYKTEYKQQREFLRSIRNEEF